MGLFRRAKVKQRPKYPNPFLETLQVVETDKSDDNDEPQDKYAEIVEDDMKEESSYQEIRVVEAEEESIGETLASRDHFNLYIPIKQREPSRSSSGKGFLLPSGRSFSKRLIAESTASTVSSVSYDSLLFGNDDTTKRLRKNKTISMRSIKNKESIQAETVKRNNVTQRRPSSVDVSTEAKKNNEARKQSDPSSTGCWCWMDTTSKRQDIESRVPDGDKKTSRTVKGVKSPKGKTAADAASMMNSTVPTFGSNDALKKHEKQESETREPTSNSPSIFQILCGPRQIPAEELVADDATKPLQRPIPKSHPTIGAFRAYERPLQVEQEPSLLNAHSSHEEKELPYPTPLGLDDQATIPTYLDEGRTTIAHVGTNEFSRRAEQPYDEQHCEDLGGEPKNWKLRLPRTLPKVRSLSRSLSRRMSFRSTNRSQKSGKSGRSWRSRGSRSYGSRSRGSRSRRSRSKNRSTRQRGKSPARNKSRRQHTHDQPQRQSRAKASAPPSKKYNTKQEDKIKVDPVAMKKNGRRKRRQ